MTPEVLAAAGGALAGLGLVVVTAELIPAPPDLRAALTRLGSRDSLPSASVVTNGGEATLTERIGGWLATRALSWRRPYPVPHSDLAVLRRPVGMYFGQKLMMAALAFLLVSGLDLVFRASGWPLPILLGTVLPVGAAVLAFFLPDLLVHGEAEDARMRFRHVLGCYLDLVALERAAEGGPAEALERASSVAHSWQFVAIRTELQRARLSGVPPWTALTELGAELDIVELRDLGEVMSLAGDDGAAVNVTLLAQAESLRKKTLSDLEAAANTASERMTLPGVVLALGFLLLICYPALAHVLNS
jgi:hypothetical protein